MMKRIAISMLFLLILCPAAFASDTSSPQLRVLTYNIHHGQGTDGKFDYDRLAKIIMRVKPDVVALQEVDKQTGRASGIDQAKHLGELTGMKSVFGQAMPYSGGQYGEAILSRFPMTDVKTHPLPFKSGYEPRAMIAAKILPNNGLPELIFAGTHLCHQSEDLRIDQAKEINRQLPAAGDTPVILTGDMNARQGSDAMNTFLNKRWIDATKKVSRIDYILIRPNDPWRVVEVKKIDEPVASDHDPVLAVLEWTGDKGE